MSPARGDAVTWLGHAGASLDLDGTRLVTDPVLRFRVGPLRRHGPAPDPRAWREPAAVLVSHLHHDHLDLPSLRRIGTGVPVVVPAGAAALLDGFADVREVVAGDELRLGTLHVTAVPARHPGDRPGRRLRAAAVGYVIRGRTGSVWFAGDTGAFPALRELRGAVDLALLPVGGWGPTLGPDHLDPRQAAGVAALVAPRRAVPIHWGTLLLPGLRTLRPDLARAPGARFAWWTAQQAVDTEVVVLAPGGSTAMP
ncbi:L-ascorbate metabolism protein UlaG, beta-lactamase superfamily [Jatrophihabitans endophyticus]|uniref:L-ascorbate metabolism protein UlaG, beta-lactamase superfamily n=1 Tax=Jatrophihabitans endophyticus TaxID=1206085 RepID=A0A1M5MGJ2_9ACTN|nr:MBL fold metallo-hydrolase [Jatrophihabitans endophyticus]SHG76311.1 L-ascorbate metabolism protein UlaG, beta-lactamase superfamily [Jatrophihabitans endophyticus]